MRRQEELMPSPALVYRCQHMANLPVSFLFPPEDRKHEHEQGEQNQNIPFCNLLGEALFSFAHSCIRLYMCILLTNIVKNQIRNNKRASWFR